MTKVKMDVIGPWIAKRATELLGFEDEVLINFLYGLLDAKLINTVSSSSTLFRAAGKVLETCIFFLLKAETDRIAQEIQKRRDRDRNGRELECGRKSRFDGEADSSKFTKAISVPVSKFSKPRTLSIEPDDDREKDGNYDPKVKDGHSPEHHSTSPPRHSPRDIRSPSRQRSPLPRQRSRSRSRHRSPASIRYRLPRPRRSPRRRSRSQVLHHRSPSPFHQRSPPIRHGSPSPWRRRSPSLWRRRSPSPLCCRSPVRARRRSPFPISQGSPIRHGSISPARHKSPSPSRRSPLRSPKQRRRSPLHSPTRRVANSPIAHQRKRSHSPYRSRSPRRRTRRSLSRERDSRVNGSEHRQYQDEQTSQRFGSKRSLVNHVSERQISERTDSRQKASESVSAKISVSLCSPQRDFDNLSSRFESLTYMPKINRKINRR